MNLFQKISSALFALFLIGCGTTLAQWQALTNDGLVLAGDVCKVGDTVDPANPPEWVTVECTVTGIAGTINQLVPWTAWQAASTTTAAKAKFFREVHAKGVTVKSSVTKP